MEKFSLDLSNKLVGVNVVFVTGEGCESCVGMVDVVNQVSKKIKNVNFYILNVEESYLSFLENYQVRMLPTILIIKDNKLLDSCHGYQPEEILELWLDAKISEIN